MTVEVVITSRETDIDRSINHSIVKRESLQALELICLTYSFTSTTTRTLILDSRVDDCCCVVGHDLPIIILVTLFSLLTEGREALDDVAAEDCAADGDDGS